MKKKETTKIIFNIDNNLLKKVEENRKYWNKTRTQELNEIIAYYFKEEL